jgi:hypothetical protein
MPSSARCVDRRSRRRQVGIGAPATVAQRFMRWDPRNVGGRLRGKRPDLAEIAAQVTEVLADLMFAGSS